MSQAATAQTHSFKEFFEKQRTLETYPTGAYRWGLLVLVLVGSTLMYYDLGFSGLLPLWMASLHFTAKDFGYFMTFAMVLAGVAAGFGGPLADRYGRVVVMDTCAVAMVILSFSNLMMMNFWSFLIIRGLMFVVAGVAGPASQGLIRDYSPRWGRASGYGFVGLGAVGGQWLWTFVPGVTLPHFHTWQSQIWIMSLLGLGFLIPIALWLKDIPADIRNAVIESEIPAAEPRSQIQGSTARVPETAKAAYGELLIRWEIWVLVLGCVLMITVPITMQTFAPLMYVQVFKYTPAQASKAASYFFLAQALMGLPAGCLADILRMRKALSFAMALTMAGLIAWWAGTFSHPLSLAGLGTVNLLVGGLWSLTYIPWAAFYSEYLEDVAPALQATGWSFLQIVFRFWLASAVFLQPIVAQHFGWVTWVWFVALAVGVYAASLIVVPGYWGRTTRTAGLSPAAAHA